MSPGFPRLAVHVWAILTLAATFVLITSGGLVTSHGAGMAVPDWPSTYGYNMFLFPISQWIGGVFYEHTHRLIASAVGLMTVILAIGLLRVEPRRWVKVLALVAGILVVIQGVLGGLRVTLIKDEIGIFHGMLAQSFFAILGILALATSPLWLRMRWQQVRATSGLGKLAIVATAAIFLQLMLGAAMRHEHAGLAIKDFPTAYGSWWPNTDADAMERINEERHQRGEKPTSVSQIHLQMTHRLGAVLVLALVAAFAWRSVVERSSVRGLGVLWLAMVFGQVFLGAWTIWSNKAADVATAHVALGALLLLLGVTLSFFLRCALSRSEVALHKPTNAAMIPTAV